MTNVATGRAYLQTNSWQMLLPARFTGSWNYPNGTTLGTFQVFNSANQKLATISCKLSFDLIYSGTPKATNLLPTNLTVQYSYNTATKLYTCTIVK